MENQGTNDINKLTRHQTMVDMSAHSPAKISKDKKLQMKSIQRKQVYPMNNDRIIIKAANDLRGFNMSDENMIDIRNEIQAFIWIITCFGAVAIGFSIVALSLIIFIVIIILILIIMLYGGMIQSEKMYRTALESCATKQVVKKVDNFLAWENKLYLRHGKEFKIDREGQWLEFITINKDVEYGIQKE